MKRFAFPLEAVLKFREHIEEQAELALARALRAHELAGLRLRQIEQSIAAHQEQTRAALAQSTSAATLAHACSFSLSLAAELRLRRGQLEQAQSAAAESRQRFEAARRDREILERLRHRQFDRHQSGLHALEQKEFDERATLAFNRGPNPAQSIAPH